jgi:acyl-CoA synthetase (AMP-forming)/AMP-acid ligase II
MAYIREIVSLADVPRVHARRRPDAPAVLFEGRTTTYAEWRDRCFRLANGLIAAAVKPGSRIAILDKNSDVFFEVLFGVAVAGGVAVPLNWRLAAPEIRYILVLKAVA